MKLSDNGLRKIEGYEGYGRALPNGDCTAYQDKFNGKLDRVTIGWGCTEGVELGMIWTRAEAEAAFKKELAHHEAAVNRLVTVDMSQNQFDVLTSLSYNVGSGALAKSTVLKRFNAGDKIGASHAFALFNRGPGGIVDGLIARRASEAALFLKPDVAPAAPAMPQTVTESPAPVSRVVVAVAASTVATAVQTIPPAVPEAITKSLGNVHAWQGIGEQLWSLKTWAVTQPVLAVSLALSVSAFWLWSKRKAAS